MHSSIAVTQLQVRIVWEFYNGFEQTNQGSRFIIAFPQNVDFQRNKPYISLHYFVPMTTNVATRANVTIIQTHQLFWLFVICLASDISEE